MNHEVFSWTDLTAIYLKAPRESFDLAYALCTYSGIISLKSRLIVSQALKWWCTFEHGDVCRRFGIGSDAGHRVFLSLHPRLIRLQLDVGLWGRDLDRRESRGRWREINRQGIVTIHYFITSRELIWCLAEEIFQSSSVTHARAFPSFCATNIKDEKCPRK